MRTSARSVWSLGVGLLVLSFILPDVGPTGKWRLGAGTLAFLGSVVGLFGAVLRPAAEWQAPQVLGTIALALAFLSNFMKL